MRKPWGNKFDATKNNRVGSYYNGKLGTGERVWCLGGWDWLIEKFDGTIVVRDISPKLK